MLKRNLIVYYNFFKNNTEFASKQVAEEENSDVVESDSTLVNVNDTIN